MPNEAHHEAAKPAADVLAQADVVPGPVDQDAAANAGLIICVSKAIKALEDDRLHHEDDKECVKALDAILTLLDGVQGRLQFDFMGMDDTLPSAEQHAQLVTMTVPGLGKTVPQYLNHILDVFIVRVLCNPALSHPALKDLCNTTCRVIQVLLDVEVITMCRSESEEVIKVLESNRWMEPGSSEHSKLLDLIAAIEKKVNPGNRDRVGTMRWRTGAGIWAKGASDFGNALRALEAAYGLACVVGKVLSGFTGLPHGMPHGLALLRASGRHGTAHGGREACVINNAGLAAAICVDAAPSEISLLVVDTGRKCATGTHDVIQHMVRCNPALGGRITVIDLVCEVPKGCKMNPSGTHVLDMRNVVPVGERIIHDGHGVMAAAALLCIGHAHATEHLEATVKGKSIVLHCVGTDVLSEPRPSQAPVIGGKLSDGCWGLINSNLRLMCGSIIAICEGVSGALDSRNATHKAWLQALATQDLKFTTFELPDTCLLDYYDLLRWRCELVAMGERSDFIKSALARLLGKVDGWIEWWDKCYIDHQLLNSYKEHRVLEFKNLLGAMGSELAAQGGDLLEKSWTQACEVLLRGGRLTPADALYQLLEAAHRAYKRVPKSRADPMPPPRLLAHLEANDFKQWHHMMLQLVPDIRAMLCRFAGQVLEEFEAAYEAATAMVGMYGASPRQGAASPMVEGPMADQAGSSRGGAQDHAAAAEEGYLHAMAAGVLPAAAAAAAADRAQSPREGSPMAISPVPPEEDGAAAAAAAARALEAREDLQAADAAGGDGGAAVDQTPQGHKRDKPFTPSPDSKQAEDAENKVRMGKRVKEAAAGDNTAGGSSRQQALVDAYKASAAALGLGAIEETQEEGGAVQQQGEGGAVQPQGEDNAGAGGAGAGAGDDAAPGAATLVAGMALTKQAPAPQAVAAAAAAAVAQAPPAQPAVGRLPQPLRDAVISMADVLVNRYQMMDGLPAKAATFTRVHLRSLNLTDEQQQQLRDSRHLVASIVDGHLSTSDYDVVTEVVNGVLAGLEPEA